MASLPFYEFFAGAGLVRLALSPAWSCVWANDCDHKKAAVYASNFGSKEIVLKDVAAVHADDLPPHVPMAWASFPCQDLSLAGDQEGMSALRSGAFWGFWRIMRDLFDKNERPPLIVIENVSGLLYGDNFIGLCEALSALGMQFGPLLIDARWFLPQSRPRIFIVAVDARLDCDNLLHPFPELSPYFTKPIMSAYGSLPPSLSITWRWWNLPPPNVSIPPVQDLIEDPPIGVKWNSHTETDRLLQMMTSRNRAKVQRALSGEGSPIGFLYKRVREGVQRAEVRFDGVAGCLRTPQGGSSRQTVLLVSKGMIRSRLLSSREAARLMGVPDSYHLPINYNDAYRAMGDAVAVPAVRWLSDHLLIPLAGLIQQDWTAARDQGFCDETRGRFNASRVNAEMYAQQWRSGYNAGQR